MKYVFIKTKTITNLSIPLKGRITSMNSISKEFSAYTALSDVLKSEGLFDRYKETWNKLHDQEKNNESIIGCQIDNITIRKLKLNKSNYNKHIN